MSHHHERNVDKPIYVYVIVNPAWSGWIKLGRAISPRERLLNYQTASPYRDYSVFYKRLITIRTILKIEKYFKKNVMGRSEWFKISPTEAQKIIEKILEMGTAIRSVVPGVKIAKDKVHDGVRYFYQVTEIIDEYSWIDTKKCKNLREVSEIVGASEGWISQSLKEKYKVVMNGFEIKRVSITSMPPILQTLNLMGNEN